MHCFKTTIAFFLLLLCNAALAQVPTNTEIDAETMALDHIENINKFLEQQDKLPFDEILTSEIKTLLDLKPRIEDKHVRKQIDKTLDKYSAKQKELERIAQEQEAASKAAAEQAKKEEIRKAEEKQKEAERIAEQKRLEEEQKRIAEEKAAKKRRIIYTVLAIVMAILMFVANQVIQHIRNMKTQKSIMQMQQNATTQAEGKVKQQVRNPAHKNNRKNKRFSI